MSGPGRDTSALAQQLVQTHFGQRGRELQVAGMGVRELAADFGTPLYVYDAQVMAQRYRELADALAGFAEVYYSLKANPQPEVARCLVGLGAGLEVASGGEILLARAAGCEPRHMLFAGPGKGEDELRLAIEAGIGEIHLESLDEVALVARLAAGAHRVVGVALRINPLAAAAGGAMRMGGKPAAFGIDEEQLAEAVAAVQAQPSLSLAGLHLFAGTQVLQAEVLLRQWRHGLVLAKRMAGLMSQPLRRIDLGGGLGIPYHAGQRPLDLAELKAGAAQLARQLRATPALAGAQVLVEPGRWLAGPAGVYLVSVRSVKTSRGQRFVVCDGGMHHHLAASGNLGQVIKMDYPLLAATQMGQPLAGVATVVGPLCTPLDRLGHETPLPELQVGDLVAVLQSGAYGLSASPVGFLGHPMPAEVLLQGGQARLLRRAGTMAQPLVNVVGTTSD